MAGDSKGDSVPFGTRLSMESLVCYTFAEIPAAGDGAHTVTVRSVSGFFDGKGWPAFIICRVAVSIKTGQNGTAESGGILAVRYRSRGI